MQPVLCPASPAGSGGSFRRPLRTAPMTPSASLPPPTLWSRSCASNPIRSASPSTHADGSSSASGAQRSQFRRDPPQALARPAQRRHRVAALAWPNQRQQVVAERRVDLRQRLAPAARTAHPPSRQVGPIRQVLEPAPDRTASDPGRSRGRRDPAIAGRARLARRKAAASTLVQLRRQRGVAFTDWLRIDHAAILQTPPRPGNPRADGPNTQTQPDSPNL